MKDFFRVLTFSILASSGLSFAQQTRQDLENQVLDFSESSTQSETEPVENSLDSENAKSSKNASAPSILDEIIQNTESLSRDEIQEIERAVEGPKGIPYEHIFSVQKRFIQKKLKSEISPFVLSLQPADSFRKQLSWGFSYGFHFVESLAVELLEFQSMSNVDSGLSDALGEVGVNVYRDEARWSLGSALLWTPFSAKAGFTTQITYFEMFFLAGGGLVQYNYVKDPFAQFGVGFRTFLSKSTLLKATLKDSIDLRDSENRHRFNVSLGLGFLL